MCNCNAKEITILFELTAKSCIPTSFVFSYAVTKNCSICLQPPKFCCSNKPLFQLLISRSVFSPVWLLACVTHCRATLAGHLQPQLQKHYSNTSPNLILHVQTRPPVAAELLSFSPIPPLLVGILTCVPTSYNIVLYPTPTTVLLVRYVPCTVVLGKWISHCKEHG